MENKYQIGFEDVVDYRSAYKERSNEKEACQPQAICMVGSFYLRDSRFRDSGFFKTSSLCFWGKKTKKDRRFYWKNPLDFMKPRKALRDQYKIKKALPTLFWFFFFFSQDRFFLLLFYFLDLREIKGSTGKNPLPIWPPHGISSI